MKRLALIFVFAAPAVHGASQVGLLPEDKVPVVVAENERNPFGKKIVKPEAEEATVEDEEAKIRSALDKLHVTGIMQGRVGMKVMLGSLPMEEGRMLPQVIQGQQERIKVILVSPEKVELAFLEPSGEPGLRKIVVPLDAGPTVRYRLMGIRKEGQDDTQAQPETESFDGVLTKEQIGKGR